MGLFVGQHSFCPLHMSFQQLGSPNLTGLLGRGHCGYFGLRTRGGAAGYTGEILGRKGPKRFASNHHLACLPGSPLIVIPRYPHKEIPNYTSSYLNKGAPSLHTLPLSPRGKWGAWQLGKQADFLALEFQRPSLFGPSPGASSSSQHPDPEAQNPHVPQLE